MGSSWAKRKSAKSKGQKKREAQANAGLRPFLSNLSPAELSGLMNLPLTRKERFSVQLVNFRRKVTQNGV